MYDETEAANACFDPNIMQQPDDQQEDNINALISHHHQTPPFTPIDHLHVTHNSDPSMELDNHNMQMQIQMQMQMQNPHLGSFNTTNDDSNNWIQTNNEMGLGHFEENPTSTTDLLTLLHLPRCSFGSSNSSTLPQNPSITFGKSTSPSDLGFLGELNPDNPSGSGSSTVPFDPATISYDPLFHLNLPPQPSPLLRDLMFQSLPHGVGYGTGIQTRGNGNENNGSVGNSSNSLFCGLDEREGNIMNGIYQDGEHNHIHSNGIFEFRGNVCLGDGKEGKCPKNFVTERQRRQNFNDKYQHLRSLVPSPTKGDRASIVGDAINYIQELKRTVGELKHLVEKKRISKERVKRLKTDHEDTPAATAVVAAGGDNLVQTVDGSGLLVKPDPDDAFNGSSATQLRSSWLQRKCKDTEVDVRIVDDEVTIKLVQRKKINCLLSVSRTLEELQLDLSHVAGGHVGDYYSYLFNTKICEGSSVYASAIANKLVEVVERQHASA